MTGSIAQTIQGEAGSDPASQFAVATTIFNRMQAGTYPGGTNPDAIVNAPNQFVGSAAPNSTAQMFANAIQDGTLGNYGTIGNAVNFQTAGSGTTLGSDPNAINIGGNNFSDNFGTPTANFQAPVYTGGIINGSQNAVSSGGGITLTAPSDFNDPSTGSTATSGSGSASASGGAGIGATGTGSGDIGYSAQPTTSVPTAVTSGFNALANQLGATTSGFMSGIENWLGRGFVMLLAIVVAGVGLWMLAGRPTPEQAVNEA